MKKLDTLNASSSVRSSPIYTGTTSLELAYPKEPKVIEKKIIITPLIIMIYQDPQRIKKKKEEGLLT